MGFFKVYRICRSKYAHDLKGSGSFNVGGRWNSSGKYMLYTSSTISLCMLEILANSGFNTFPGNMNLVEISIPNDSVKILKEKDLPPRWRSHPINRLTQSIGNEWIDDLESLILAVPSVIVPQEYNYLINPTHPRFSEIKIDKISELNFDERLIEVQK